MHKQGRYSCNSRRSFMTTPSLPKHRTACLISAVLLATTAFSAGAYTTGKAGTTPQAQYQADVAHCKSGQSNQNTATRIQEAVAALEAAKQHRLANGQASDKHANATPSQALSDHKHYTTLAQKSGQTTT